MASQAFRLDRPAACAVCGISIPSGEQASWDADAGTTMCLRCRDGGGLFAPESYDGELERGEPGASLQREYERRKSHRETRVREAHPRIGGLLLALGSAPQSETAFSVGAAGERELAELLERRTAAGPAVLLHNRRMPKAHGDIDHLATAPSGVFVIDAKNLKGKVRVASPLLGRSKLLVAGRDRTSFIAGLDRQVAAVRDALEHAGQPGLPIRGVLCFIRADLPLVGTLKMDGHRILSARTLARRLNAEGPLSPAAIGRIARVLASAFPPA
jgi:hypothetical protein